MRCTEKVIRTCHDRREFCSSSGFLCFPVVFSDLSRGEGHEAAIAGNTSRSDNTQPCKADLHCDLGLILQEV